MTPHDLNQLRCLYGLPADQLEKALLTRIEGHRRALEVATDIAAVTKVQGAVAECRWLLSVISEIRKTP